ncbi:hypothetical protein JHN49_00575 [Streptomyces sp. MBT57]|nr:hypothetical protein [Streptomyces sp. MBT57]
MAYAIMEKSPENSEYENYPGFAMIDQVIGLVNLMREWGSKIEEICCRSCYVGCRSRDDDAFSWVRECGHQW